MATDTTGTTTNDSTRAPISTNQLVLGAVVAAIQAKREAAIAQISLYVNNPASITDCNSFVEEIQSCVTQLAEANAALETIQTTFSFTQNATTTPSEATTEPTNRF